MMAIALYSRAVGNKPLNTFHKQSIQQIVLKKQMSNNNYSCGVEEHNLNFYVVKCELFQELRITEGSK